MGLNWGWPLLHNLCLAALVSFSLCSTSSSGFFWWNSILEHIGDDLPLQNFLNGAWMSTGAHPSMWWDINVPKTHQFHSSIASSHGAEKIWKYLGTQKTSVTFRCRCIQGSRAGARASKRDYVIRFYPDRTPDLKNGLNDCYQAVISTKMGQLW